MRLNPNGLIEVRLAELTAAVQSVRDQLMAHQAVADEVTRGQLTRMESLDRQVVAVSTAVEKVSYTAAEHLEDHAHAVNPHPEQEKWLREHMAALGREISALAVEVRTSTTEISRQMSEWKGSLRIVAFVGAPLVGVVSGVVVTALRSLG